MNTILNMFRLIYKGMILFALQKELKSRKGTEIF